MSNDLVTTENRQVITHPFQHGNGGLNVGATTIESERAIAEARGQIQMARMFPRDWNSSHAELMDICKLPAMAEVAFYSLPQGGKTVEGPTIKLMEQIATCSEHFEWGHRELSRIEAGPGPRDFGRSEVEVYAWDKQKNNRSIRQITVMHTLDTKEGPRKLRDQRDIDNKIANVASKQMRGRLQALLPKWLVEAAQDECRKTIAGNNTEPLSVRVRKMTQAFSQFGVNPKHLEDFLGHKLDSVLVDELVRLTGVFNAIREGESPSEFFKIDDSQTGDAAPSGAAKAIAKAAAPKSTAAKDSSKTTESPAKNLKETEQKSGEKKAGMQSTESSEKQDPPATENNKEPETPAAAQAQTPAAGAGASGEEEVF